MKVFSFFEALRAIYHAMGGELGMMLEDFRGPVDLGWFAKC